MLASNAIYPAYHAVQMDMNRHPRTTWDDMKEDVSTQISKASSVARLIGSERRLMAKKCSVPLGISST